MRRRRWVRNGPLTSLTCSLVGAYRPSARTKASLPRWRTPNKDGDDDTNRVRVAQVEGFLPLEDAAVTINAAAATPIVG